VDSLKSVYGQVALVDNGGFFPETDAQQDLAWFLMDAMKLLGTDAVGLGERDLRFGVAYLRSQLKRTQLPMVCSNLLDKRSRKTLVSPYVIKKIGSVRVGFFGLIGDQMNLGPAKDSLQVEEPLATARRIVPEMRKKGAEVVVLLAQLGKVPGEDLVSAVDGIDAVIIGHNAPMLQKGRTVKNTVACYGGEQGQYVCRTDLALDAKRQKTGGEASAVMLGAEFADKPEILKLVKSFEDGFNEKLRKVDAERVKQQSVITTEPSTDHFIGAEMCVRCHKEAGDQWKTTSHSLAWETLVHAKKEAAAECVPCHVSGYGQPGGFRAAAATPQMANVQCESCHGMGTQHDAFAGKGAGVAEQTCTQCHNKDNDADFDFQRDLAKVVHSNLSGETLRSHQQRIQTGGGATMKGSAH
jgi:hypothetical protein